MKTNRRLAWILGAALVFGTLGLPVGCAGGNDRSGSVAQLDVLLITLDTTRRERLSCYGHTLETTPNFDQLAAEGIRFDRAIAQAPVTPTSHASILTGRDPYSHGLRVLYAKSGYRLTEQVPTLTTVLRKAGYNTGAFLSSFAVSEHFGFDRGFQVFDSGIRPGEGRMEMGEDGFYRWPVESNQRRSDETTDLAIEWLRHVEGRFFAWIHYWDPHDPLLTPPVGFVQRFVRPSDPPWLRRERVYDAEISFVDQQFGRLLQSLKDTGRYENTIIVVIADHGEGLADGQRNHGWYHHRILYQEQIHVPFLLRLPGGPRGRAVPELVRSIDIYPTILETLGLESPEPVDGVGLLGLLEGQPEPRRLAYADVLNEFDLNAAFVRRYALGADRLHCLMDRTWKLIYRPTKPASSELYNLEQDPAELENLYAHEPEQAQRLLAELERRPCFVNQPFESKDGGGLEDEEALERLRALGYVSD